MARGIRARDLSFHLPNALVDSWKSRYSRNSLCNLRHTLRRLLLWLEDQGAPRDLESQLKHVPPFQASGRFLSDAEMEKLLDAAAPWMRCFLLICLTTSMRSGEARRVAPVHYDRDSSPPLIRGIRVKNNWEHKVPVHVELQKIFEAVQEPRDSTRPYIEILKGQPVGQPLTFSNLVYHFNQLKKKTGILDIRMHHLRATAITRAYIESGNSLVHAQRLAGHASGATTMHYVRHVDQAALEPVVQKLVPFRKLIKKKSGG